MAIDGERLQELPAAERQQPLRQLGAALARLADVVGDPPQVLPRLQLLAEMFGVADHDREQVVEVVGDAAGQLPDDFHFLRLAKLLLGVLALGQVVDDSDKDRLAVLPGFADRQLHRKGRTILAQADRLAAGTRTQEAVDLAIVILTVGRRHQHLDVFVEDFVGPVTEQPLASRVEQQDAAPRVDQDEAVERGFDHRREPRHAFALGALSGAELRQQIFGIARFGLLVLERFLHLAEFKRRRNGQEFRQ